MRVLWDLGEGNVTQVHQLLSKDKAHAYTTIATMLKKMEGRKLLNHRVEGRTFIYFPIVKESDVTRNMTDDLVDRLFKGSLSEMVSHLLQSREVSAKELKKLEELIAKQKRTQ